MHIISNGYDPNELAGVEPYPFNHFAIVYVGGFYQPKRVITPVMAALQCLESADRNLDVDWRFHYYGWDEAYVREVAASAGLNDRVILHGNVPRREALSAIRGAGVAVVITSVTSKSTLEDRGIVTGKVFESLGLGTPTLLIAPPGSDIETIGETAGLARRFSGEDIGGIASFLCDAMRRPRSPSKPGRELRLAKSCPAIRFRPAICL